MLTKIQLERAERPVMKAIHLFIAASLSFCSAVVAAQTAPSKFVVQVLEPTGGKIERPSAWFYAEDHGGPVYRWTLSREDTSGNRPYTTGVKIQAFTGVKQGTGKTAKEFALEFAEAKKKETTKELWQTYSSTFNRMSSFELIDMKRFTQ
jgi:hypothetical protein